MDLWLPTPEDAPEVPEWFMRSLRDIDSGLVIYWNRFRGRFIIDRCTKPGPHTHNTTCPKANVLIVQSDEGSYMPPNQRTIDKIKAMDAWMQYGGNDETALLRMRTQRENAKAEYDEKIQREARDNYKNGDDRLQLNKVLHLMQQHDIARVH